MKKLNIVVDDSTIPEPNDPPTPVEPELERLLVFFIQRNKRLAWMRGGEKLIYRVPYTSDGINEPVGLLLEK